MQLQFDVGSCYGLHFQTQDSRLSLSSPPPCRESIPLLLRFAHLEHGKGELWNVQILHAAIVADTAQRGVFERIADNASKGAAVDERVPHEIPHDGHERESRKDLRED